MVQLSDDEESPENTSVEPINKTVDISTASEPSIVMTNGSVNESTASSSGTEQMDTKHNFSLHMDSTADLSFQSTTSSMPSSQLNDSSIKLESLEI